ncbi:hypothetical protein H2204_002428 [Knufia peltigerae]|uniref:Major facilitator superfamily (MFS) profile domain-containing protein n=1 Tax=Knufia peltigerae TaxID=1002370 RepID=A0AA38YBX4_9EURO|nr:hypothetical protein H2204_002428 [Knufia peltigerae]
MVSNYQTMQEPSVQNNENDSTSKEPQLSNEPEGSVEAGEPEEPTYSEGGPKAILILFGCFCAFFSALSMLNSIGAYQASISQDQLKQIPQGSIGWIFGFHGFFSFFSGLFFGPLFDAWGPKPLAAAASCTTAVTYLTLGVCRTYWEFFLCIGVMGGLTTALMFTAAMGTVQHWFFRHRGMATGIAVSGGSVGGIVFPTILGALIPRLGFQWATRVVGLTLVPVSLISLLLMKARFSAPFHSWRSIVPSLSPLRRLRNLLLAGSLFFVETSIFIPVAYLASYGLQQGLPESISYRLLTFLNVGSLIGRWLPGYLGDKIGRFNAFILALVLCLVSVLGIWLPAGSNKAQITAFAILFGIGSGSGISLAPACLSQLCNIEEYGRFFTTFYTVASFGSLIGIPISGQILEATKGDFYGLIVFAGLAYGCALFLLTLVRVLEVGWAFTTKF